ncbi:universal stress protein [Streptomyces prasinosporus]|uniref:Universal stress protein n=1 Tax=Streptomyces prasinosporus TaxID=68256 RepID=A0ABP6U3C8_9ACTN
MELPLVVGVDGSESALRAVDWAADEAALRRVPLRLVHASLWEHYEGVAPVTGSGRPGERARAETVVEDALERARTRRPEVKAQGEVVPEEPEYVLLREGREATAVVVGSRGRGDLAEALLGSVSLTVAARAHCPVIVLRGGHDGRAASGAGRRVLVGVGEGARGAAAVRFAAEEARLRGVPLEAVRAWQYPLREGTEHPLLAGNPARPYQERAAQVLEEALRDVPEDVEVRRRTVEGPARRVLAAASDGADLLVVGARRRPGHHGLQLGRVAHAVLHRSACPVAVVPHPG